MISFQAVEKGLTTNTFHRGSYFSNESEKSRFGQLLSVMLEKQWPSNKDEMAIFKWSLTWSPLLQLLQFGGTYFI